MKQHITKKQWLELNDEEMDVIRRFVGWNKSRLLNIGQMIEFLGDENYPKVLCEEWGDDLDIPKDYIGIPCNELCDALWEAVKYKTK